MYIYIGNILRFKIARQQSYRFILYICMVLPRIYVYVCMYTYIYVCNLFPLISALDAY